MNVHNLANSGHKVMCEARDLEFEFARDLLNNTRVQECKHGEQDAKSMGHKVLACMQRLLV